MAATVVNVFWYKNHFETWQGRIKRNVLTIILLCIDLSVATGLPNARCYYMHTSSFKPWNALHYTYHAMYASLIFAVKFQRPQNISPSPQIPGPLVKFDHINRDTIRQNRRVSFFFGFP